MRRSILLAPALFVAACGSDEPGTPVADVGVDTSADVATDAGNDASADSTVDTTPAEAPVVTQVLPNVGPVEGLQRVGVLGRNFVGRCSVSFGDVDAGVVQVVNDGALDLRTPPAEAAGVVDVEVTCDGGSVTVEDAYTYEAELLPDVFSMSPTVGHVDGGEAITFAGENFTDDGRTLVRFGDDFGENVTVVDDATLQAETPAREPGVVSVSVEVGDTRVDLDESFTFVRPLTVSEVVPFAGDRAGGTRVRLVGTDLVDFVDLGVTIGDTAIDPTTFAYASDDEVGMWVEFDAPGADALGLVDVQVTGLLADVTLEDGFAYVDPVAVGDLAPDGVPTVGTNRVTITGAGFEEDADPLAVFVGDEEAFDVSWDSATSISFLVPPVDAGAYTVTLVHGFEEVAVPETLEVYTPITISEITPAQGSPAGGTRVDLTGTGFVDDAIVLFGAAEGTDVAVTSDGTTLSVTTPAGTASTTVDVTVRTRFSVDTLDDGFTYGDGT